MKGNTIYKEKVLHTNNKFFKYVEKGEGDLIILVHGWPETWYSWRHNIDYLSQLGYKVIAFNCRGYADSYSPESIEEYAIKEYIYDILDIIKFFKYERSILIGHDWGAPISWNTAALFPDKVKAVIGLSVPYYGRGKQSSYELWKKMYKGKFFYQNYFQKISVPEKELEKNISDSLKKIYYWISYDGYKNNVKTTKAEETGLLDGLSLPNKPLLWLTNKDVQYLSKEFEKSGFKGPLNRYRNQHKDWVDIPELANLKIISPSLFIGGKYDPVRYFIKGYDSYEKPDRLCDNFYGSYIIKKCGHWVQQEKPGEVNKIIKNFLKNIS